MKKSIKSGYLFILTIYIVLSFSIYQLIGCGGGGGGSSSSSGTSGGTVSGSAKYYINVTLKFPENTSRESQKNISPEYKDLIIPEWAGERDCPYETLISKLCPDLDYYEVWLLKAGTDEQIGETKRVERPQTGSEATITFFDVPEGKIQLVVKGYSAGKAIVGEGESTIDVSLASVTGSGSGGEGGGTISGGGSGNNEVINEPVVLPTGTVVDGPSAPKITSVEPKTISIGDTVTIRGSGFGKRDNKCGLSGKEPVNTGESCIYFGGVKATEYIYWSDTYIVCRVPKNATLSNLNVCVSVGGGSGGALISAGSSSSTVIAVVPAPSGGGGGGGGSAVVDSTTLIEVPAITAGNYTTVNLRLGTTAGSYTTTGTQIQQIRSFYIGKYEVTNTDFCSFLNASDVAGSNNPSEGSVTWWNSAGTATYNGIIYTAGSTVGSRYTVRSGFENRPICYVSWYGAVSYCNWLTLQKGMVSGDQCYGGFAADGLTRWGVDGANYHPERKGYRLPTEAEWEYISRFNTPTTLSTMDYFWGENYNTPAGSPFNIATYCWYTVNSGANHHDVGGKTANGLGLYDTGGNEWEWCSDVYNATFPLDDFAGGNAVINPKGTKTVGFYRILRGGGWGDPANCSGSQFRNYDYPSERVVNFGFRLARTK